jgi:hypothetical protein
MRNLILLLFIVVFGIIGYLAFNPESKVQPGGEEIILPGGDEDVEIELVPNDFRLGDIENFIDTYIVQKFIVADVYEDDKRVILNIGGSFPRQKLALVIWSDDFRKFSNLEPFKKLKGKQVICRGLIDDSYKGQPQVVIREAHQLELRD